MNVHSMHGWHWLELRSSVTIATSSDRYDHAGWLFSLWFWYGGKVPESRPAMWAVPWVLQVGQVAQDGLHLAGGQRLANHDR